jgi:HEAT repeat protein
VVRISFEITAKVLIVFCIVSAAAYAGISYHNASKVVTPWEVPLVTQKIESAPFRATKDQFQEQGDSNSIADFENGEDQKHSQWVNSVLTALNDPKVKTRVRAVRSLRDHPSPEAVDLLCKFMKDNNKVVVRAAIDILGYVGLHGDQKEVGDVVFDILAKKAMDKSFPDRDFALTTAALIGKESLLPVISDFLFESEEKEAESARDAAMRALSLIDSPACIPLFEELLMEKTEDPDVHQVAFDTLASIGTPEALALLEEHFVTSNGADQATSAQALAWVNKPEFNQVLSNQLKKGNLEDYTVEVLATSPAAPEIFGRLLSETTEKEKKISYLKKLAIYAPTGTREVRSGVTAAIAPLLDSPDTEIQIETIKTIAQIGTEDTGDILIEKLEESDESSVRQEVLVAMCVYATKDNYKPLLDLIWDEEQEIRRTALMLAEQFIQDSDLPVLEKARDHKDETIREQVKTILKLKDLDKNWEENEHS